MATELVDRDAKSAYRPRHLPKCAREGCTAPHVLGDRFCFDHLDPDELEAALTEPDDDEDLEDRVRRLERATAPSAPEEVAPMPPEAKIKAGRIDPPWECPCGRFQTDWPASKAKHLLRCDGKPPALSGRIAARASGSSTSSEGAKQEARRRPPPAAKTRKKAARRVVRPRKQKRQVALVSVEPKALVIPVGASARLTFLEQLRHTRERIDGVIAAVESLG